MRLIMVSGFWVESAVLDRWLTKVRMCSRWERGQVCCCSDGVSVREQDAARIYYSQSQWLSKMPEGTEIGDLFTLRPSADPDEESDATEDDVLNIILSDRFGENNILCTRCVTNDTGERNCVFASGLVPGSCVLHEVAKPFACKLYPLQLFDEVAQYMEATDSQPYIGEMDGRILHLGRTSATWQHGHICLCEDSEATKTFCEYMTPTLADLIGPDFPDVLTQACQRYLDGEIFDVEFRVTSPDLGTSF